MRPTSLNYDISAVLLWIVKVSFPEARKYSSLFELHSVSQPRCSNLPTRPSLIEKKINYDHLGVKL